MVSFGLGFGFAALRGALRESVLRLTASPVLNATEGIPYAGFTARASGGSPPYTFSLTGSWPEGISINEETGAVSGTPTAVGSFSNLSITVEDDDMATAQLSPFTLVVSPVTLSIDGEPVLTAQVGVPYEGFTVTASGGVPPYTYSVVEGELPDGLSLNSSTGAVSGTPTESGSFADIVIGVEDSQ